MNYTQILRQFQRQDTEFLWACIPKFKEAIGEAILQKNKELEEISRKQLQAVKEILTTRCG